MGYFPSLFGILAGAFAFWVLFVKRATRRQKMCRRDPGIPDSVEYNLARASLPGRSSGFKLLFLRHMSQTWIGKLLLTPMTRTHTHYNILRDFVLDDSPIYEPVVSSNEPKVAQDANEIKLDHLIEAKRNKSGFRFSTLSDYFHAYRSGTVTPEDVAESVMAALEKSDQMKPSMRMVTQYDVEEVYKMAKASTVRINNKTPLSIFDGIPVVIKEEISCTPYHLRGGTSFLGRDPVKEDSTVAAKLRAGGAVIIGLSNMHEVGIGVAGINISEKGTSRNPYNTNHYTGGSSSGSGACVASGLCPIAIGTDGGGSIRIPSTLCGIVGLKPTFGRVSRHGGLPIAHTVSVLGPMTTCVQDTALLLAFLAGPDPKDSATWQQPPLTLTDLSPKTLDGLKIGIDWRYFRDANSEVVAACEKAVGFLEQQGAELVAIQIPEHEEAKIAHLILITSEMYTALQEAYRERLHDFSPDTGLVLSIASGASACEYINANKQRARTMHFLRQIFKEVDVIVCPGSGVTAPRIQPGDLECGINDTGSSLDIIRFSPIANLTGIPGLVVPVGYDAKNLPIGLQVMGPWWEENRLLRVGSVVERLMKTKHEPQVFFDILADATTQ